MMDGTSHPPPPPDGGTGEGRQDETRGTDLPSFRPFVQPPSIRAPSPRPSPFAALGHRNFRIFFSGYIVSLVGVWMHRVAQAWLVLDLTDSAFYVGLVEALGALPVLLFTLYAGVVADRVSKHRLVIGTQSTAMIIAVALSAVVLTGVVEIWHVLLLAGLLGVVTAFDIPARQSFFAELVGKRDLMNAIALNSSAFNASRVIGPAIAGFIIAALGVGICFLINAVSYVAVLIALLAMRIPPFKQTSQKLSTWIRIWDGVRYVTSDRRTRLLMGNIAVLSLFGFPFAVLMPVMARDVLGGGAQAYGWMTAAVGVGAVVGALGLAAFGHVLPKGRIMGWTSLSFGVLVALFGLIPTVGTSLIVLLLLGFAQISTTAVTNTLIQTLAPDEFRGRVVSFYTFAFMGFTPFGALGAGVAAETLGPRIALVVGGAVCLLFALTVVLRSQELAETH